MSPASEHGDLWALSATAMAVGVAQRTFSATELLEAHLARIEACNGHLNAVVALVESARAAARAADQAVRDRADLGPLHGVPFSVKENIDVEGAATTHGLVALREVLAPLDAPVVARLRAAGAVPFARTNLPDLGLRLHTRSSLHGLTRNPFNPEVTAGGSSGGEASAIAAGMSPLGLGNDIGGSLRNPAYCCGIASLKPTPHRIASASSTSRVTPGLAGQLMAVQGPLARHVGDLHLAFSVLAGVDVRDPWTVPVPLRSPRGPCKVGVLLRPPGGTTNPAIVAGVEAGAHALARAGYEVLDVSPEMVEDAMEVWADWLLGELAVTRDELAESLEAEAQWVIDAALARFGTPSLERSYRVQQRRLEVARAWAAFFDEVPLLIGPTWTEPPFRHDFDVESVEAEAAVAALTRFVTPMNAMGLPAVCVPTGLDRGLPLGMQVVGWRFDDERCLEAAAAAEAELGVLTPITPVGVQGRN